MTLREARKFLTGKKVFVKNNQITFVDAEPHWKSIKTFD